MGSIVCIHRGVGPGGGEGDLRDLFVKAKWGGWVGLGGGGGGRALPLMNTDILVIISILTTVITSSRTIEGDGI